MDENRFPRAASMHFSRLALIGCVLCNFCSAAEDAGIAVLSFDYSTQEFSEDFIDWVAEFGARRQFTVASERSVADILNAECGGVSSANVALFEKVLSEDAEISPGAALSLPPCLPLPDYSVQPRIAQQNDSFWRLSRLASNAREFEVRSVPTYSAEAAIQANGPLNIGAAQWALLTSRSPGAEDFVVTNDGSVMAYRNLEAAIASYGPESYRGLIDEYWRDKGTYGQNDDLGAIAYDAAYLKSVLKKHGVSIPTGDIVAAGIQAGSLAPGLDTSEVVALTDVAATRWRNSDFEGSVELAAKVALSARPADGDFWDSLAWLEPKGKGIAMRNPNDLHAGDIIVTTAAQSQRVQIPVDRQAMLDAASGSAAIAAAAPPAAFAGDASTPEIVDMNTFSVDEMESYQCAGPSQVNWDDAAFERRFMEAALRTRIHAERMGKNVIEARVVIADSGFVRTDSEPFRPQFFKENGRFLERQAPDSRYTPGHRTHGTAVAALAIGGPTLWPLAHSLGIDLSITPYRIFGSHETRSGRVIPFFSGKSLREAVELSADIYNFSFGSRDETYMANFRNLFVTSGNNKLFVIAAGNNNLNDSTGGVDLGLTSIYPQYWAGNETGVNILLVAALDGNRLAGFSNHSATRVSLAAPGCGVASWKPEANNRFYEQAAVSGTSFSAPIVTFVAAMVKALSPSEKEKPSWIRARLIASADVTDIAGVEHGRILNPVKAISLSEDVIELVDAPSSLLHARVQLADLKDICAGVGLPPDSSLLKLARIPASDAPEFHVYYLRNNVLSTTHLVCKPSAATTLTIKKEDDEYEQIPMARIKDVVFRYEY